jgi:hypothetical protein
VKEFPTHTIKKADKIIQKRRKKFAVAEKCQKRRRRKLFGYSRDSKNENRTVK